MATQLHQPGVLCLFVYGEHFTFYVILPSRNAAEVGQHMVCVTEAAMTGLVKELPSLLSF